MRTALARAGRKRRSGLQREPNGRATRAYVNPMQQVASQPHRRAVPEKLRERAEAESEFGRLMLRGHITPAQHEAGKQYAELAAKYRAAILAPSHNPAAIDLGRVGCGKSDGMPDSTARSIKRAYDSAFESCEPVRLQKAIAHYVIHDRLIDDFDGLKLLKAGLDKLVVHFGIDENLQISHVSNRR